MRRLTSSALCIGYLLLATTLGHAGNLPDPLRFVPDKADFVIKVETPGKLIESFYHLEAIEQLYKLDIVRTLYDNPESRRLEQILRYIEKKLGHERYALLDQLTGGGALVAGKFGGGTPVVLAVVQARDEKLLRSFIDTSLQLIEQEAGREGKPFPLKKARYRDHEVMSFDDKLFVGIADGALLAASKSDVLKAALDCFHGEGKSVASVASLTQARREVGDNPAAWGWLNLAALRDLPGYKKGLDNADTDPNSILFLGPFVDVARRASHLSAALHQKDAEYLLSFRAPTGREGMSQVTKLALAPAEKASLPLLEPQGVIFSASYFLDLKELWDNRAKLLKEPQLKQLEDFDKNSGRFLAGAKISRLVELIGSYQRFVMAQLPSTVYKQKPQIPIPSFAIVVDMRDPAFGKSMDTVLRGAALLAGFQVSLTMVEEDRAGAKLVTFRFAEDKELKQDTTGVRFNFSPSFTTVRNQFVVSSTVELGRELIDAISKEDDKRFNNAELTKVYSSGAAAILRAFEDQLITQAVLAQALDPNTAREQLQGALRILDTLGALEIDSQVGQNETRYDIRLTLGKR